MGKEKKSVSIPKPAQKPKMYIGRSLPGLAQYTVFSGEIPQYVAAMAEKSPEILGLIVEIDKVQEARQKVQEKGSLLNQLYKGQFRE